MALPAFAAAADGAPPLRCRWNGPDGAALDLVFQANPLIIVPAGGNIEVSPVPDGKDTDEAVITVLRDGQPFRRDKSIFFTAPEKPGAYYLSLAATASAARPEKELCVLVPHPAAAGKTADGWELSAGGEKIGFYRHPSRSGNAKVRENPAGYQPPAWWFRLTGGNSGFEVIPGLTAGELVSPPEDGGPRHTDLVPVCYPMWLAIHTLRKALPGLGLPETSLRLISLFRAPAHNRGIGSNSFSRHVYGDAFDFYIGLDADGVKAADLNRDGKLDRRDAWPLIRLIEDLQADGKIPLGGLGVYNTVGGDHEVTLHVDLRGHRATWGYLYDASGKRSEFAWASRRFADLDRRDEQAAAERAAGEKRKYSPPRRESLP
jgi:hypothetical protein